MYVGDIEVQVPLQKCRFWRPYNRDLTFLVPRIPWEFWYYMGLDWVFSRLYILLRILSSNAFWHFGLGKCKLMILRCRFHCKNTGFEDLTTLTFLVPRIPWEFWYYMGFDGFFLGCTFCCAFFPGMPLDILVLENVCWWYWGAGSTAKMQVLKTLQQGSYIFWFLEFRGKPFFDVLWDLNVAEWLQTYADIWLNYIGISFLVVMFYRFYSFLRDVLGCSVVFLDVFLFIYVFFVILAPTLL